MGNLKEDIQELRELVIKDKGEVKEKKFKFPFGTKVGRGQKKRNYVTVQILMENGIYAFKKYQIIDQTIIHNLIPRLANAGLVMFDKKGNPLIILPEWSVEPFSPRSHFEGTLKNGSNIKGFSILMNKMKSEAISSSSKMGGAVKWIIGIAIAAIIGYALLTGGG